MIRVEDGLFEGRRRILQGILGQEGIFIYLVKVLGKV